MKPYGVSRTDEAYEAYRAHDKPIPLSPADKRADRTRKKTARQQAERANAIVEAAQTNRHLLDQLIDNIPEERWPTLDEFKAEYHVRLGKETICGGTNDAAPTWSELYGSNSLTVTTDTDISPDKP